MPRFTERTEKLLRAAGWYPGRRTVPYPIVSELKQGGYPVTDTVIRFLEEFGDLRICHENGGIMMSTKFYTLDTGEPEVGPIRDHLKLKLCPVANTFPPSWMYIGSEGGFYDTDAVSGFDLVGHTADEMFENLFHRRYVERILDEEGIRAIFTSPTM